MMFDPNNVHNTQHKYHPRNRSHMAKPILRIVRRDVETNPTNYAHQ